MIYELPFPREQQGLTGKVLGGWHISSVYQAQDGTPFSVATADDFAGVGPGSGSQFWVANGDASVEDPKFSQGTVDQNFYFNPSVFSRPAAGTIVTDRVRNRFRHPGFQNFSGALFKTFGITETHRLTFRSEFYNIPNHPNWSSAQTNPTNANFGRVTSKSFERSLQLSLRYSF